MFCFQTGLVSGWRREGVWLIFAELLLWYAKGSWFIITWYHGMIETYFTIYRKGPVSHIQRDCKNGPGFHNKDDINMIHLDKRAGGISSLLTGFSCPTNFLERDYIFLLLLKSMVARPFRILKQFKYQKLYRHDLLLYTIILNKWIRTAYSLYKRENIVTVHKFRIRSENEYNNTFENFWCRFKILIKCICQSYHHFQNSFAQNIILVPKSL